MKTFKDLTLDESRNSLVSISATAPFSISMRTHLNTLNIHI